MKPARVRCYICNRVRRLGSCDMAKTPHCRECCALGVRREWKPVEVIGE